MAYFFDTGDCCLPFITPGICDKCLCHEDLTKHPEIKGTTTEVSNAICPEEDKIGDGYCDDITNVESCSYDGGDCCNEDSSFHYCHECLCHPNTTNIASEKSTTLMKEKIENTIIPTSSTECPSCNSVAYVSFELKYFHYVSIVCLLNL